MPSLVYQLVVQRQPIQKMLAFCGGHPLLDMVQQILVVVEELHFGLGKGLTCFLRSYSVGDFVLGYMDLSYLLNGLGPKEERRGMVRFGELRGGAEV